MYQKEWSPPPYRGARISFRPWWGVAFQRIGAFLAFAYAGVFGLSTLSRFHYGPDIWIAAVAFAVGLLFVASIFRTRIVLDADGIEMSSLFGVRRIRRSDVVGYRLYKPGRGRPYIELRSRDPQAAKLDIALDFLKSAAACGIEQNGVILYDAVPMSLTVGTLETTSVAYSSSSCS